MSKTFGGIELGGTLGGYEIINIPATKLPPLDLLLISLQEKTLLRARSQR